MKAKRIILVLFTALLMLPLILGTVGCTNSDDRDHRPDKIQDELDPPVKSP